MSRPRYYIHKYVSFERCETGWGAFDADENKFVAASSVQGVCLWKEAIDAQTFSNYLNYQEILNKNLNNERIHDLNQIGGLQEENAKLKDELERDNEIHRRNTAMWKDDCEKYREEISKLNAEVERIKSYTFTHEELDSMKAETELLHGKFKRDIYNEALADNAHLKAEVERLRKAGDAVIHEWSSGHGTDVENFTKAMWIWTVAKGEKPSV